MGDDPYVVEDDPDTHTHTQTRSRRCRAAGNADTGSTPNQQPGDTSSWAVAALTAKQGGPDDNSAQAGHLIVQPIRQGRAESELGHEGVADTLRAGDGGSSRNQLIAITPTTILGGGVLTGGGHDASEDGTGRGTPIVAEQWAGAFHMTQDPISSENHTPVLSANASIGAMVQPLAIRGREGGAELEAGEVGAPYNALRAGDGGSSRQSLISVQRHAETIVRRLTEMECERLQGFPDNWTAQPLKDVLATILISWDDLSALLPDVAANIEREAFASCITSEFGDTTVSIYRSATIPPAINVQHVTGWLDRTGHAECAAVITNHGSDTATHFNQNGTQQPAPTLPRDGGETTEQSLRLNLVGHCDAEKSSTISTLMRVMTTRATSTSAAINQNTPAFTVHWNSLPPSCFGVDYFALRMASTERASASARYRQLGNSVAVPCVEWLARRLVAVDEQLVGTK